MTITVPCPRCGEDVEVEVSREGGDWVPYGSTSVRTPSGWVADVLQCGCEGVEWTDAELRALEESACYKADDYDPREDREDVP